MTTRFCLAIFAFFASALWIDAAETLPPKPDRYFNDYAKAVSPNDALRLNERLAQFERETSNQFLVAIYPKMESSSSVDDFTQRIAQSWGVGQKEHKNGVVLFVFVQEHQMFIQTGYGLEGALPDATCSEIIRNVIAPRFKAGDYTAGLTNGIDVVIAASKGEYHGSGRTHVETGGATKHLPIGVIVFLAVVFLIIAANRSGRRRGYWFSGMGGPYIGGWGGGGWSGGSSGGGFSGFSGGGGSFGGGGAGGSW